MQNEHIRFGHIFKTVNNADTTILHFAFYILHYRLKGD